VPGRSIDSEEGCVGLVFGPVWLLWLLGCVQFCCSFVCVTVLYKEKETMELIGMLFVSTVTRGWR
jgi:hypothetical protein